jgi:hypothetical protein
MNEVFSKEIYDTIYKHISDQLSTGTDRINKANYEANYIENFELIKRKVEAKTYKFTRLKELYKNNRIVYSTTIRDKIVLEYLKRNIQKKYKIKLKSREQIIGELKTLIDEPINYFVFRTDISAFFSSIDHKILIQKLKKNSLFTVQEFYLVANLLEKVETGLPQGTGVSNYLSEMYMEQFDIYMRNISPRIKYYARYVDDIVMVIPGKLTNGENIELKSNILDIFKKYKLEINEEKTQMVYMDASAEFDYLGYCFRRKNNKLQLHISNDKITRMFSKMDTMFQDYAYNLNYELLRERLRVFSSVNKLFKTKRSVDRDGTEHYFKEAILFGINIDYKYATNEDIIKLNNYIKKCIIKTQFSNRKQKNELYSMQIRNQYDNYRLIAYGKIPIMELKSVVYRISIGTYSWIEIMRMRKSELISLYFRSIHLDI